MDVPVVVLGDRRRWVVVVRSRLPSVHVLRNDRGVQFRRECSVRPLAVHKLVVHHDGPLGVDRQGSVTNETWFPIWLVLGDPDIIV